MYLAADPTDARRTPSTVATQLPQVEALFSATLELSRAMAVGVSLTLVTAAVAAELTVSTVPCPSV